MIFLVILNMFMFNFWSMGIEGLKPPAVNAATTATYTESWSAAQLAISQITDWGGANIGSRYILTTSRQPGWISGGSRTPTNYQRWVCWWWWCCWWNWWWWWSWSSYSSNNYFNAHIDPHAFVTQWTVAGTLTKQ